MNMWMLPGGSKRWLDPLLNVMMYLPPGMLVVLLLRRWPPMVRLIAAVLFGFLLSLGIEIAQVYDVSRYPSSVDLVTNTLGALLGGLFAVAAPGLLRTRMKPIGLVLRHHSAVSALLVLWVIVRTFPVFPYLSVQGVLTKMHAFGSQPWLMNSFLSAIVMWNSLGILMELAGLRRPVIWLSLSVLLVPLEFAIWAREPEPAEIAGAILGTLMFALLRRHPLAVRISALIMLIALLLRGLAPFSFSLSQTRFDWIPLQATLRYDRQAAWYVLLEKSFWYGTAVWLVHAAGIRLVAAALIVAALLAGIEAGQMWQPGRTPEITDPLLALAMAWMLSWAESRRVSTATR